MQQVAEEITAERLAEAVGAEAANNMVAQAIAIARSILGSSLVSRPHGAPEKLEQRPLLHQPAAAPPLRRGLRLGSIGPAYPARCRTRFGL